MMTEAKEAKKEKSVLRNVVGKWIAICFTLFVMYSMATFSIQEMKQFSLFLGFTLAVTFIRHPMDPKRPNFRPFIIIDFILALLSFSIAAYIWIDYWEFIFRVGIPTHLDIAFSILAVLLVFEATRRTVGWPLLIIAFVFLIYTFFGQYLPPPLSHKGYDISRIVTTLFMTKNGIFGIPLKVTTHYIFLFIAFGSFFSICGGTQFFVDIATAIFGKMRGGPAKVSIAVSGMMGTISGSAVANTVTTGTFTIPLMKRIGFEPHVAGAVEATASTGGALMPPVMGAAAFIMAEFLGVPYIEVCKAALIPAILYYMAVFSIVHFYSLKIGIQGLSDSELPAIKKVLFQNWIFIVPLSTLIYMLIIGYSPRIAVLYALAATVVVTAFKKETRMGPSKLLQALADSGNNSVMVANAAITAGVVIGVVLLTGMGSKITSLVVSLSAGSLFIALPIVMLASLLFGMGLPTVVCYVLLAATVAPSLVDLGVPKLAAHLFIFYFGMLCMVTPPVSFASYAGAAIAKADPMKTGWTAWTFALAGFLLPYMFVYNKALLMMGTPFQIGFAIMTSLIGVVCLGAGIIGYFARDARIHERLLLFAAALLLIKPGVLTDAGGILCVVVTVILQLKRPSTLGPGRATA
ncbi:MAG: TRAP transporter permease [Deltaproteobacteria bacterium]|nr:TRAP transporter permease [Deltaproteobacteria bacterium]